MGIFLNPGNRMFQRSLDSEIYVDKSGLIELTNAVFGTQQCYVCVSRPRRFGKTMAMDMLCAYYCRTCDSRGQFEGLSASSKVSFERHLNKYDVVKITMTNALSEGGGTAGGAIEYIEEMVKGELAEAYPDVRVRDAYSLSVWLERVYAATNVPFVFLIDEWDCIMRETEGGEAAQKRYLDWLRNLLKDRGYVGLAYATGILPVKKYGQHSALNMFTEATVLDPGAYAPFTGFTKAEVEALCTRYDMDFEECRRWYDGYDVGGVACFNPRSVVASMMNHRFANYWTRTETFEALRRYIVMDLDGLRERVVRLVAGERLSVNVEKFQNDMTTFRSADDVFALLAHLGYLTYDMDARTVRIPNSEVAAEFANCIEDGGWEAVAAAIAARSSWASPTTPTLNRRPTRSTTASSSPRE